MSSTFVIGAMIVAMLAVLTVLGMGLYTMVRGKDVNGVQANKLMWWRVYLQAIALALFAVVLVMAKNHG